MRNGWLQVSPGGYMCTGRCTPKESPQGLHTCSPQLPMQDVPADDPETRSGLLPVRIDVSVIDSHNSGGLQTADFIVGSIQWKHEREDHSYYRMIAPAIVFEKMLF